MFHEDDNDPLQKFVRQMDWGAVLLVEASPRMADRLRRTTRSPEVFPRVPPSRIFVSNSGVCPPSMLRNGSDTELPFHSLSARGRGLPAWASQLSGFRKWHVLSRVPDLARASHGGWSERQLRSALRTDVVPCRSLRDELRRWHVVSADGTRRPLPPPAIIILDVEGLDCRVVESHDWCASARRPGSGRRSFAPSVLVFEHVHCTDRARRAAAAQLARCPGFDTPTAQDRENVYYTTHAFRQRPEALLAAA